MFIGDLIQDELDDNAEYEIEKYYFDKTIYKIVITRHEGEKKVK